MTDDSKDQDTSKDQGESKEDGTSKDRDRGARRRGNRRAGTAGPSGVLPVKAKEDDPRAWGDSPEDRDSWLLEQRPPHWG